jgi:hypothetical protein
MDDLPGSCPRARIEEEQASLRVSLTRKRRFLSTFHPRTGGRRTREKTKELTNQTLEEQSAPVRPPIESGRSASEAELGVDEVYAVRPGAQREDGKDQEETMMVLMWTSVYVAARRRCAQEDYFISAFPSL